jgi:hypothetical protein
MLRKFYISVLILSGIAVCCWLTNGFNPALVTLGPLGPLWLGTFILLIAALAWLPPTAAKLDRLIQRLANVSSRVRRVNSIAVAIAAPIYLYLTARATHRQLFPYIHDEFSYLIQARQFAAHRLWMPGHPLGMFFDSFQIFTQPVYASAYFPGTALTHLPGVLLHVPSYVTSLATSGVVMGLVYWIISELIDGLAGWLAMLLLLDDLLYRQESTLVLSHMPVLMYGLLGFFCWLKWRNNQRHGHDWAIGIGFFLGLATVTRPVDGLCFGIPIVVAALCGSASRDTGLRPVRTILISLRIHRFLCNDIAGTGQRPVSQEGRPNSLAAVTAMLGGALPLIILQLLLNHGITGSWTQTPFQLYADREYPGSNYGFAECQPNAQSESALPQMRAMYDSYRPQLLAHQWKNVLPELASRARFVLSQASPTPFPVLVLLLPLSIVGLTQLRPDQRGPAIVLLSVPPLFLLLYAPYFLYLPTYTLPTAPAIILMILLGMQSLANGNRLMSVGLPLLIIGLSLAALPNWWNQPPEDVFTAGLLADANRQLSALPHQPAVVFFKYDPRRNLNEEPVYNTDTAWPDDAPVIRLHDLGPMNAEAIRYYAERQPDRVFYWYDEATRKLTDHP